MAYAIVSLMPGRRPEDTRLSDAFRDVYESAGISQVQIAEALPDVDQPTVSKWARGVRPPPLWVLPQVERLCAVPKGRILRLAGFVDPDLSVEAAIAQDPALDDASRRAMVTSYRAFAKLSTPSETA